MTPVRRRVSYCRSLPKSATKYACHGSLNSSRVCSAMETTTGVSSYRFVIAGLILWGHLATGASLPVVSPILPIISDDYGINHSSASLLVSAWTVSFAIFCIPASILVGRIGVWRTYTISWILTGLPTLAVFSPSFEGLLVLRVASGVGAAMMVPATGPLLMQWFRPREIPIMTSLNMAIASLGLVVSTSVAAPLEKVMDWELVVGLFGASGLAVAFGWMLWGKTHEGVGGRGEPPWSGERSGQYCETGPSCC